MLATGGCRGATDTHKPPADAAGDVKAYVDPDTGELRETPAPGTKPVQGGDVLAPKAMKGSPVAGGAGMKAYIDPETGELRETPAPGTAPIEGGDVLPPKAMVDGKDE